MKTKPRLKSVPVHEATLFTTERRCHFFATSAADWITGTDPEDMIKRMKSRGYPFALWYVPVDVSDYYRIDSYRPQVDGARLVAVYEAQEDRA